LPVHAAIFGAKIAELFLDFGILRPAAHPKFLYVAFQGPMPP
jgi:hypothetical protein